MDTDLLISNGLAIGIVVALIIALYRVGQFCAGEVWPYLRDRDAEQRKRASDQQASEVIAAEAIAISLASLAHSLSEPLCVKLAEPQTRARPGADKIN